MRVLQITRAILGVDRIHFEGGGVDEVARPDELVEEVMLAQHVADVLAQKTLDALPELLHPFDVHL